MDEAAYDSAIGVARLDPVSGPGLIFRYDLIPMLLGERDIHEKIIGDLWRYVNSFNIDSEAALQAHCTEIKDSSPVANLFQALQEATSFDKSDKILLPLKFMSEDPFNKGADPKRPLEVIKIIHLMEWILHFREPRTWDELMNTQYGEYEYNIPHFELMKDSQLSLAGRLLFLLS